jgi:hypothetical protein
MAFSSKQLSLVRVLINPRPRTVPFLHRGRIEETC